ncbi:ABC transporter ATP-binding protein [Manganibacter manganicus]|uniref:ABC transporter ATP-binding protein n=1 Tax=Manganibacter manganicus TaxID=1873176 RepID=A0A1V8RLK1_9HYPH|nr:ABC transporter ATP-binding protein [Pseudaminobacter manganicus]OQM74085.1 ABC transporter ATP-binding protein [Pseudaminobacter manganicus]
MTAILTTHGLCKNYRGIKAVQDADLSVARGGITGLIGPNGSGKSTTIDCITGFTRPSSGKVSYDGQDITGSPSYGLAGIGLVRTFQNVRVYERLSVMDNLIVASQSLRAHGWLPLMLRSTAVKADEKAIMQEALSFLELVGMAHYAGAPAGILSYGQRKLVALAACLITHPKLIVLDEPLAGVNPTIIRKISGLIETLNEQGLTFLIVEHNVDFIMRHCDHVIVMEQGKKLTEGKPEDVRRDERVLEAYLGKRVGLETKGTAYA